MSNNNQNITVNLYCLDISRIRNWVDGCEDINTIPQKLIENYNKAKVQESTDNSSIVYGCFSPILTANSCEFAKNNGLVFFKKDQAQSIGHSWVNFFKKKELDLGDLKTAIPHLVMFIIRGDRLYALTTGSAYVVFEAYIDQIFPVEIAKRILQPELKGGKQQVISGEIMAADVYFRRPSRIGMSDSHEEVWKNLSGSLLKSIQESDDFKSIFGKKRSVNVEIKSSIKLSSQLNKPEDLLKFISWLEEIEKKDLTNEQKESFAFYESIRPLSNRRDKGQIETLTSLLASDFVEGKLNNDCLTLSNEKISQFINAELYELKYGAKLIKSWTFQPDINEISTKLREIKQTLFPSTKDTEIIEKLRIVASYKDEKWNNTEGNVLQHLSGEYISNGNCFYLLNGQWYLVEKLFQEVTDLEYKEVVNSNSSYTKISYVEIGLSEYFHENEGDYNIKQNNNLICGDKVFYKNLELGDLFSIEKPNYMDIIHVKLGFNASTRDAVSQLRNSISTIESDLRLGGTPVLKEYFKALQRNNRVSGLNESQFISMFKQKKRRYVFAYIRDKDLVSTPITEITSSIAKNELVSLVKFAKRLSSKAELKIACIPIRN